MVTEFVVAASELSVWNPNGKTGAFVAHAPFHGTLETLLKRIGVRAERTDP